LSAERLVIVVTHNSEIAERYADRLIRFEDGKIIHDSNPYREEANPERFSLKKTSMSFFTALKLSFNNIWTKKGRTFLTSFASSIGIIGIAVILSLSSGFQTQIDSFQSDTMGEFPILISQTSTELNAENIASMQDSMQEWFEGTSEYSDSDEVYLYDPSSTTIVHTNIFTDEYMDYLNNIDPEICNSIGYVRIVNMNLLRNVNGTVIPVSFISALSNMTSSSGMGVTSMDGLGLSSYPERLQKGSGSYLEENYDLLAGNYPEDATDLVLVIDSRNRVDVDMLKVLGFDTEDVETIKFADIVGTEFKLVSNNDYYVKTEYGTYLPGQDYETMYASDDSITLTISGIVRASQDSTVALLGRGIAYSDALSQLVIDNATESDIVKAQKQSNTNVMTMEEMSAETKATFLAYLGGNVSPYMIMVYPGNFEDKNAVVAYLDAYNEGKDVNDQVVFTDLAATIADMTDGIMNGITIVLIAFAAISLIVSLIMIGIITYTSVLERTKEIGILRALGARKKDITRVFDAETCILGVFSGALGIGIAWLLTIPINVILYNLTDLQGVANLQVTHAVILVAVSTILTIIGGHIPAIMASKKQAVEALRTE
jgi:putative ABC transport system permease protein